MIHYIKGKESDIISHTLRFDGGCAPTNPGPCAGSYVIYDNKGCIISEGGDFFENGTNNYGEYSGLISGLKKCIQLGIDSIYVEGDSLLVISQVCNKWKVRNIGLMVLFEDVNILLKSFSNVAMKHIYRQFNSYADSLCDKTLKMRKTW
jgi:probable phosphoglycerate mutase